MQRNGVVYSLAMPAAILLLGCMSGAPPAIQNTQQEKSQERKPDVIYVPTPMPVVEKMLEMAKVGKGDVVYDLGCGDGRIVIAAAKKFGARGIGVDIDPQRIKESNENAKAEGVTDLVKFEIRDLFTMDFKDANVVMLYLLPSLNVKLRPRLLDELKPGTRIVSHDFDMGDWEPDRTEKLEPGRLHTIHYWMIPAKVNGTWDVTMGDTKGTLTLQQKYQKLNTATFQSNGETKSLVTPKLAGDQISFTLESKAGTQTFTGKVEGDTMTGTMDSGGMTSSWSARRR